MHFNITYTGFKALLWQVTTLLFRYYGNFEDVPAAIYFSSNYNVGQSQRDGRPTEHRWRPLFNAAVWLTPTTRVLYSNAAKMRNPLKLAGVPQTYKTISAASGPKFTILWEHVQEIWLINKFFQLVDTCLICEDMVQQSCAMVPRWWTFWRFFVRCIFSERRAARFRPAS